MVVMRALVYAIHKYGAVRCTEIKPDFSGFVEGSDREITLAIRRSQADQLKQRLAQLSF